MVFVNTPHAQQTMQSLATDAGCKALMGDWKKYDATAATKLAKVHHAAFAGGMTMPTIAETQLKKRSAWLAASSAGEKPPMGYRIVYGPYGQLVTCGLDDLPPGPSGGSGQARTNPAPSGCFCGP